MSGPTYGKTTDLCLFGSCVCGDSIRYTQPNNLKIRKFVQFFSPVSMFDEVAKENWILPEESSMEGLGYSQHGHWARSACAAFNGWIPEILRQNKSEWLILDNYYTCMQTYRISYENGDTRLIQSPKAIGRLVGQSSTISGSKIEVVSIPHVDSWMDRFADFIKDLYGNHVILIGTRFARYHLDGNNLVKLEEDERNSSLSKADQELMKRLNCYYIEIPEHAITVDGSIKVHYVKEVFEYIMLSIRAILQADDDKLISVQRNLKLKYESILSSIVSGTRSVTRFDLKSAKSDDLKLLESNGSIQARSILSQAYREGRIVPQDPNISVSYMRAAFNDAGEPLQVTYYNLLRSFKNNSGLSESYKKEFWSMTKEMAAGGFPSAMLELGVMYRDGISVPKDVELSKTWFRGAYDNGIAWAGLELSNLLLKENDEHSCGEGVFLLTEIAESGNAVAKGRLGRLYLNGTAVPRNHELAMTLLEDAYRMNVDWAGLDLSDILIGGETSSEVQRGVSILQDLANRGNGIAMGKLGRAYRDGTGVEKNESYAAYWLQQAYKSGVAWAGIDLANMELHAKEQGILIDWEVSAPDVVVADSEEIQCPSWKQGPVYIVICGAVRNLLDVSSIVLRSVDLCNAGVADGIVLSTWKGEFDDNPAYKNTLESLGVRIVQSKPLPDSWNEMLYLNNARQAVQLNAALEALPEDCYILKCRTDLSFDIMSKVLDSLPKVDLSITDRNRFNIDFRSKVLLTNIGISAPFHSADLSFYGHSSDIRRMVLLESKLYLERDLPADCGFFMAPFIHRFPLMADVLRIQKYWDFSSIIKRIPECSPKPESLPTLLNKFYAQYFLIIDSCYVCYDPSYDSKSSLTMDDLFTESTLKNGIKSGWIKTVVDTRIIHRLIVGDVNATPMYDSFQIALNQALNEDSIGLAIGEEDVDMYNVFISQFNIAPVKWSRLPLTSVSKDVDAAAAMLAPYISNNVEEAINILKEISIPQSTSYYRNLVSNLEEIHDKDPKMYELALISCAKGTINSDSLLKDLAYALYTGSISEANITSANYPFIKFGISKRIYFHMPASSDLLLANYYYSLYSVDTDDKYSKLFIESITKYFGLTLTNDIMESLESLKNLDSDAFDDSNFREFLGMIKVPPQK